MLARRDLLRLGLGASAAVGLGAASATAAIVRAAPAAARQVALHNLHTGEKLQAVYFDKSGYVPDAMHAVNHVLRDYRTGDVYPIDPKVLDLLASIQAHTGSRQPYQVICGYRSPRTNAMLHAHSEEVAQHSLHMKGQAIDIRLADGSLSQLHDIALNLKAGGVGYYPESDFVHVDVGAVRRWQGT